MNRLLICLPIISLALLSACGSEPEPEATVAPARAPEPAAESAPEDPTAKMARAVGSGKPGAAVGMRYEFLAKPAVGTPVDLQIFFIPRAGVEALDATIGGMEGITVTGPLTARFEEVEPGEPYEHTVTVLPDRTGVFYVSVAVNTQFGGSTLARTFSIPFVVGTAPAKEKAQPQTDASGEPIEPMKAEER